MADEEESGLPAMVAKITLAPIDASQVLASVEAIRTKFNAETFNINVAINPASLSNIAAQIQTAIGGGSIGGVMSAGAFGAGASYATQVAGGGVAMGGGAGAMESGGEGEATGAAVGAAVTRGMSRLFWPLMALRYGVRIGEQAFERSKSEGDAERDSREGIEGTERGAKFLTHEEDIKARIALLDKGIEKERTLKDGFWGSIGRGLDMFIPGENGRGTKDSHAWRIDEDKFSRDQLEEDLREFELNKTLNREEERGGLDAIRRDRSISGYEKQKRIGELSTRVFEETEVNPAMERANALQTPLARVAAQTRVKAMDDEFVKATAESLQNFADDFKAGTIQAEFRASGNAYAAGISEMQERWRKEGISAETPENNRRREAESGEFMRPWVLKAEDINDEAFRLNAETAHQAEFGKYEAMRESIIRHRDEAKGTPLENAERGLAEAEIANFIAPHLKPMMFSGGAEYASHLMLALQTSNGRGRAVAEGQEDLAGGIDNMKSHINNTTEAIGANKALHHTAVELTDAANLMAKAALMLSRIAIVGGPAGH